MAAAAGLAPLCGQIAHQSFSNDVLNKLGLGLHHGLFQVLTQTPGPCLSLCS